MNHSRGVLRGMKAAKRARKLETRRLKKVRYQHNLAKRVDAEIEAMKHQAEAETAPKTQASSM